MHCWQFVDIQLYTLRRQCSEVECNGQYELKPTEAEVEEHNLTHLPYRSWCRHCVRGRGKEMPHRKLEDEAGMPEVHADLCFLATKPIQGTRFPCL